MPVEIFCCYARKDQQLLNDLRTHLMSMQRSGDIIIWADTDIDAGVEWEKEIENHLDTAQIILLLVSPNFISSEYCYGKEMTRAMERHKAGEAQVIPIILRPVLWEGTPFRNLQALPTGVRPVISSLWHDQDDAFFDVAYGIQKVVQRFHRKDEQFEQSELAQATVSKMKPVPTGFVDLDRLTGGLHSSDLIIVEAPSATGKTNFAMSIALNAATKFARSIGIFSLETNEERLTQRLISLHATIELQCLHSKMLEDDEWVRVVIATDDLDGHIWIDDSSSLSVDQLRSQAHKMVLKHSVDLIIVDYVNLLQPEVTQRGYEQRGHRYREISRCLKVIARELNVPTLVLVQMQRKVNNFGIEPGYSDAQDISIENDADVVMYIYRDDRYNPESERRNIADIIITKHRSGSLGEISLYCDPRTGLFSDLMVNTAEKLPGQ